MRLGGGEIGFFQRRSGIDGLDLFHIGIEDELTILEHITERPFAPDVAASARNQKRRRRITVPPKIDAARHFGSIRLALTVSTAAAPPYLARKKRNHADDRCRSLRRNKPDVPGERTDRHPRRICGHRGTEARDTLEENAVHILGCRASLDNHVTSANTARDGTGRNRHIAENAVAQPSGTRISNSVGAGAHPRLGLDQNHVAIVRTHANVLEEAIRKRHARGRLKPEYGVRPVAFRRTVHLGAVYDVDVARLYVAHFRRIAFVAQAERIGAVRPESAILHENISRRRGRAVLAVALDGDDVVLRAEERAAHGDVPGIADVERIIVYHVGVNDLDIVDKHPFAIRKDQRPGERPAHHHIADRKVATFLEIEQISTRPLEARISTARQKTPSADGYPVPRRFHATIHDRSCGKVKRLSRGKRNQSSVMHTRAEIHRSVGISSGSAALWRIGKQQKRSTAAIALKRNLKRLGRLERDRVRGFVSRNNSRRFRQYLHAIERLRTRHANFHRIRKLKPAKTVLAGE